MDDEDKKSVMTLLAAPTIIAGTMIVALPLALFNSWIAADPAGRVDHKKSHLGSKTL